MKKLWLDFAGQVMLRSETEQKSEQDRRSLSFAQGGCLGLRKLLLPLLLFAVCGTAAFAGSSSISITAPQITSASYSGVAFSQADIDALNNQLSTMFGNIQTTLNTQYFSNLHDLGELSEGFANANTVASSNPNIMGYENYNLFSLFLGASLGFAVPTLNPSGIANLGSNIVNTGDIYGGLGTGGIAGQLGLNTSSFLVRNLYLSLKFGYFNFNLPSLSGLSGGIHEMLLGIGANYKIVRPWGLFGGLVGWHGLSLGTGFEYNRDEFNANVTLPPQTLSGSANTLLLGPVNVSATMSNLQANLDVVASSFVVPVEIDTSIQLLWFNLGIGVGADINLPFSTIGINGNGTTVIGLPSNFTYAETPGSIAVNATDSQNTPGFWDYVSPKLSADLGINFSILKIDIPVAFYPLTKAVSLGLIGGVSW
jgi:hypothetical protein